MTDTGQVPGEGLPENAGTVEQPGVPAPGAYTYLDPADATAEDDELLLMPGSQGAWGQPQAAPAGMPAQQQYAQPPAGPVAHEPGPHEMAGRDSGHHDLGGMHMPGQAPAPVAAGQGPARRPLHMGPPMPEAGGSPVRSLADRGPAQQAPHNPMPARQAGPPTTGPEYLDIPPQGAAPWQPAEAQPQPGYEMPQAPAETVVPDAYAAPQDLAAAPQFVPVAEPTPVAAYVGQAEQAGPVDPYAAQQEAAPQPLGQFVPVEGSVPTTPHLAPTPPQAMSVPPLPEPAAEPVVEPTPEPAAEPLVQPVVEAEPIQQPVEPVEPMAPAAPAEPVAEQQPVVEPVAEPVVEPQQQAEAPIAPEPVAAESVQQPEAEQQAPAEVPVQETEPVEIAEPVEAPVAPQPVAEQFAQPEQAEQAAQAAEQGVQAEQAVPAVQSVQAVQVEAAAAVPAPRDGGPAAVPAPEPVAPQGPVAEDDEPDLIEVAPEPVQEAPEAEQQAAAPGYDDAEREAVLRVMRERRDIRNGFRSDPIPHEVLLRVLEAAHTAPSVGHSQPWDFVVIRSAETRRTMHELAMRQKDAYAKSLPKGRAKQFKELKIEAILDTPVNIVVTADPTRGGRHTLGRHTQPQMAPYSSALAVENLWLAARAEGLGVGWVSFFDEREMVRTLGLPEHLEVVAYLCVGYVDEFPDEPELMQAGWAKRRPLSWVVHEETYGRRALPGEDPHDLLSETVSNIRPLDAKALGEAWERQKRMTKPAGALGMLEIISAQLSGLSRMCPPPIPEPAAVAIFAGDHGVHAQGVTPWPQEVTGQMVANFLGGGAVCNAFANQVGAEVCVIDVGVASELPATPGLLPRKVRAGTADMTTGPALTREEVKAAIEVGIETARDLVAAGNKALLTGEMGIANTTASAALISVYTEVDPAEVTGRGTGINDETHARKIEVVRRALDVHKPDPADPIGVLSAVGGLEHAAMVGLLLGGASLRTPVILDGVSAGAAALVARAIAPEVLAACIAGHRSAEPGHVAALNKLGLRPLVDLDLRLGEGTGALLALPIVQSAARAMHEVATFDSAGVTEK
ncbi:nicotinate-nucleotide--dimethylbenzimidazole phosphoribosyltransferase [Streptomyces sp. VRA16 Mangrove soil]|uniref:nicotinate-nucleotide--dimethylbenzimidazole phosphoribosyltransferase n=1 Tax=Streptomyces sp. VRA16 Mangrove soil TaxID=2817434 RepID=UPI001A9E7536|nr:nicotinate-nucleotide--dimethylbenzimidazole phosphoribosyltransferase [Streptomyces sp. VRA16 Mangrove soil]MBO1331678.1 nicotinate-nucleotide--dimethylbenzimidazole phosphoribosyltransferase [Streptomyces sp. VRA16 Mangrove soil]